KGTYRTHAGSHGEGRWELTKEAEVATGRKPMRKSGTAFLAALVCGWAGFAQASDGRVKIGVLHDASGPYSHNQGQGDVVSIRLALEDFGKQVLGKDIEVVYADHQNKTDVAT